MEKIMLELGLRIPEGAGVAAAIRNYTQVETASAASR
jgi:hypothetical protein